MDKSFPPENLEYRVTCTEAFYMGLGTGRNVSNRPFFVTTTTSPPLSSRTHHLCFAGATNTLSTNAKEPATDTTRYGSIFQALPIRTGIASRVDYLYLLSLST